MISIHHCNSAQLEPKNYFYLFVRNCVSGPYAFCGKIPFHLIYTVQSYFILNTDRSNNLKDPFFQQTSNTPLVMLPNFSIQVPMAIIMTQVELFFTSVPSCSPFLQRPKDSPTLAAGLITLNMWRYT